MEVEADWWVRGGITTKVTVRYEQPAKKKR
jgi:NADPH-dependent 7-cyano-7-deazaguanine reductase QueF